MPVESAADRAAFLAIGEFAEAATYTPVVGSPVTINGIYEAPYEAVDLGGSIVVAGSRPTFICRTADLPDAIAPGDTLAVSAGTFSVKEWQTDGSGMTVLQLTST